MNRIDKAYLRHKIQNLVFSKEYELNIFFISKFLSRSVTFRISLNGQPVISSRTIKSFEKFCCQVKGVQTKRNIPICKYTYLDFTLYLTRNTHDHMNQIT